MKNKKFIFILSIFLIIGTSSSYYSYRCGVTAAHEAGLAMTMPIIQHQHGCIKSNDKKCIGITNELLTKVTHISAMALMANGVGLSNKMKNELVKYNDWYKQNGK